MEKKRREAAGAVLHDAAASPSSASARTAGAPTGRPSVVDSGGRRRWGYTIAAGWGKRAFTRSNTPPVSAARGSQTYSSASCAGGQARRVAALFRSLRRLLERIGPELGRTGHRFRDDPTFSEAYELRGPDEARSAGHSRPGFAALLGAHAGPACREQRNHCSGWSPGACQARRPRSPSLWRAVDRSRFLD